MIKIEEKIKQKRGGSGGGDTMKMVWDVGSVNDEKTSCEKFPRPLLGARDMMQAGLIVMLGGD